MSRRRSSQAGLLIVAVLVATACDGEADVPATSDRPASSTASMTSAPDDFTEVPTSDVVATLETSSVNTARTPDETVAAGSTDTTSTSGPPSTDEPPPDPSASGSATAGPDQTGSSASDRALAEAFTAQLDADDDDEGFGEVFDTGCLGTELVVAFGGATAAEDDYGLSAATVTADGDLFDDEPLSRATADAVVVAFGRCGDFDDLLTLSLASSAEDDDLIRCVIDAIPDGAMEASFSEDLQQVDGPALDALDDAIDDAFDACLG